MCRSVEVHRSEWEVIANNIFIENVADLKCPDLIYRQSTSVCRGAAEYTNLVNESTENAISMAGTSQRVEMANR